VTPPMTTPTVAPSGTPSALRARILAMALVPSLLFITAGLAGGWHLTRAAQQDQAQAATVVRKVELVERLLATVLDERDAAVLGSAGDQAAARAQVDATAGDVRSLAADVTAGTPTPLSGSVGRMRDAVDGVATARSQVQGDNLRGVEAYEAYEPVIALARGSLAGSSIDGSDASVVAAFDGAATLLSTAGAVRDATVLASQASGQAVSPAQLPDFVAHAEQVGSGFDAATATLDGTRRDQVVALLATPRWRQFSSGVTALLAAPAPAAPTADREAGTSPRAAGAAPVDLDTPGRALADEATEIADGTATDAAAAQQAAADAMFTTITVAVLAAVAVATMIMIISFRAGSRLIRRLGRLRDDALHSAEQLPRVLDRLREGEDVDIHAEMPDLQHGDDEIGQVAAAVNRAQRAAAGAAGEEARTRAGANAVFLNIAHRSQAIVHRQLQLLDEAERAEDNSDQLARLYQLDHLTTRERRNAENLIIMGGRQPRRQWRKPVSLTDIARSAISESEQYTRITLGDVPAAFVDGTAVGDLIHLLAELVDNATSFSPPQCPIDVHAHAVGRGVVVEVQDRGLGIEEEPRARLNRMLADPPDFGLMTLSDDSRLGLFVVARLAHRHGVRVTLRESAYGGVQAIVLVPNAVLVDTTAADDATTVDNTGQVDAPGSTNGPHATIGAHTNGSVATNGHGAQNGVAPEPTPAAAPVEPAADTPVAPTPEPVDPAAGPVVEAVEEPVAAPELEQTPPTPPLPELPERRPQVSLAQELHEEPAADVDDTDEEPPVQRSRSAMSALQKGSRAARGGGPAPGRNGDRP
jgi:signal transduction histidine kinase